MAGSRPGGGGGILPSLFDPFEVRQLLEVELDRYLSGRAGDACAEVPLYKADNQPYLYYAKGAVVLFAIRDLLGEEAMDRPSAGCAGAPPHEPLHAVADAGQAALIDQWTKEIVLYDLRVDAAQAHRRADGRYGVIVRVEASSSRRP